MYNLQRTSYLFDNHDKSKRYKRERTHTHEFQNWLKDEVKKRKETSMELLSLVRGSQRAANKFSDYVVNRFRFHTKKGMPSVLHRIAVSFCKP